MHSYALTHVTDEELLADLGALVATDRRTTAALLAHLAEVDARKLFLPAACSSMLVYCVRVLRLAEEVAFKRIRAARAARRFPQIFDAIADGRLHVTGVVVLAPHLTDENIDEVIASAAFCSKAELEMIVARLAPKQDVPAFIAPLDPQRSAPGVLQLDPGPVATGGVLQLDPGPVAAPGPLQLDPDPVQGAGSAGRLQALAPDRFVLQCTVDQDTRDKLEWLLAMMSHGNPSRDLGQVIRRACDALIKVVERERFAVTERPRSKGARPESEDPSYVPAEMQRAVYKRDGGRCTFTSECGERCGERRFLQIDHIVPVALRGKPTLDNLRLRCGPHNQHEADRTLGADFMAAKRAQAKAAAKSAAVVAANAKASAKSVAVVAANANAAARSVAVVANASAAVTINASAAVAATAATTTTATAATTATATAATTTTATAATATATENAAATSFAAELVEVLTSLGYSGAEARRAVVSIADLSADTFEGRLRAALASLSRSRPIRCSDGSFDLSVGVPLWVALQLN